MNAISKALPKASSGPCKEQFWKWHDEGKENKGQYIFPLKEKIFLQMPKNDNKKINK